MVIKKLLGILVLGLLLITPSQADDISDFEIEGMSVGDSALDYFSEEEIKKFTKKVWPNTTYVQYCSDKGNYNNYEYICFAYLKKDKKYIIEQLSGEIDLSFKDCLIKQKEIVSEIIVFFKSAEKNERKNFKHRADKKGKSIGNSVQFFLKDGSGLDVACTDWSKELTKKKGWTDYLGVFIASGKFIKWNKTKAFN